MKHFYSYYDPATGLFTGDTFGTTDEAAVALNVHAERPAVEGRHDPRMRRVDLATGEVVDYAPPAPAAEVLKAQRAAAALEQIAVFEAAQPRAVREMLLLGTPAARARLAAIDEHIAALRTQLA